MTKRGETQALTVRPCDSIAELDKRLHEMQTQANLLSPVSQVDSLLPLHQISLRVTNLDIQSDTYDDPRFCKNGERAIGKTGLMKIMQTAGVTMVDGPRRLDDRSDPCYCAIQVTLGMTTFDGCLTQFTASKELDMRDGAPETMKKGKEALSDAALGDKRRHIVSLCETKAILRALRGLLGLKQKYTAAELKKPFVIPKLVPALDAHMDDPVVKQALLEKALGSASSLYGRAPATREIRDAGRGGTIPPLAELPEAAPDDAADIFEPAGEDVGEAIIVCECPCGHQEEITEEIARSTGDKVGSPRCQSCYPSDRTFDFEMHPDDDFDLGLPSYPGYTVARLRARASS